MAICGHLHQFHFTKCYFMNANANFVENSKIAVMFAYDIWRVPSIPHRFIIKTCNKNGTSFFKSVYIKDGDMRKRRTTKVKVILFQTFFEVAVTACSSLHEKGGLRVSCAYQSVPQKLSVRGEQKYCSSDQDRSVTFTFCTEL